MWIQKGQHGKEPALNETHKPQQLIRLLDLEDMCCPWNKDNIRTCKLLGLPHRLIDQWTERFAIVIKTFLKHNWLQWSNQAVNNRGIESKQHTKHM